MNKMKDHALVAWVKWMNGNDIPQWIFTLVVVLFVCGAVLSELSVSVTVEHHDPWDGLVDIECVVSGFNLGDMEKVVLTRVDTETLSWVELQDVWLSDVPVTNGVTKLGNGTYHFVWDAASDVGMGVIHSNFVYKVTFWNSVADYCVIDLSGGADATHYPVGYLWEAPSKGWPDEYKTTKLLMRRIPAGTFLMGSPTDELGRMPDEMQHSVNIDEDFWIGVYDVTQKQWELVMRTNPSDFKGDTRPVECVSYSDIRGPSSGASWPGSSAVDVNSFLGKLRSRTGLLLDLPTEAQWEYACRAGTVTALNNGKNLSNQNGCPNLAEVGRYTSNTLDKKGYSQHAPVGSYRANAWGLYDMHGNVEEWCLDWYGSRYGTASVTNPRGATSGQNRVRRGGCWNSNARNCRSAYRKHTNPLNRYNCNGFRLSFSTRRHRYE